MEQSRPPYSVIHRRRGTEIIFSDGGIAVRRLLWPRFEIPWANVDFVCPTPTYERTAGAWRPVPRPDWMSPQHDAGAWLVRKGILSLAVVVRDRKTFAWHVPVRPLFGAGDQPEPKRGVIELDLRTRQLDGTISELLELAHRNSKIDLLVVG